MTRAEAMEQARINKRLAPERLAAYADAERLISIRPVVLCPRQLPWSWREMFRTLAK